MDTPVGAGKKPPARRKLPDERVGKTFKVVLGVDEPVEETLRQLEAGDVPAPTKIKAFVTANVNEDGQLGEIFITPDKEGTLLKGLLDGFATLASISLQYGVPLSVIVKKFMNTRFGPQGITNNDAVPLASSIFDLIVRRLALEHLPEEHCHELGIVDHRLLRQQAAEECQDGAVEDDEARESRPSYAGEEGFEEQEGWEWEKQGEIWAYVNRGAQAFTRGQSSSAGEGDREAGGEAGAGVERAGGAEEEAQEGSEELPAPEDGAP
jgi:hypothetical protein